MSMKITPDTCPECGGAVHATADFVPGNALLTQLDDGSFDYSGETKMCWDGQYTAEEAGKPLVLCENGHQWPATIEDVP